jgi:putative ABC transport system permease protein
MTRLALTMLWRDWRAGELRVLAIALVLAVASVTSVGFFADRLQQALTSEANQLLGGDVVLASDHPLAPAVREEMLARKLQIAQSMSFTSMARAANEAQLVAVKAVSDGYPLRGRLRTTTAPGVADADTTALPAAGEVWVDERMAGAFSIRVGDRIELGNSSFKVGAILTLEPDRGTSFFNFAPRLLMRIDDVAATGLVQDGSRAWYHLLGAGERADVAAFEQAIKGKLGRGESLQSLNNARPEIRGTLDRASQFVNLAALLAVVLAAVAIALGTQFYIKRHLDGYAVMRCLGATQPKLLSLLMREFALLGVMAAVAGALCGYIGQGVIVWLIAELIRVPLPAPTLLPALQGCAVGIVLLLGFALPPLLQLKNVPALRVLRRDLGPPRQSSLFAYTIGLAAFAGLVVWQAADIKMGLTVFGGFCAAFALFGVIAWSALKLIGRPSGATGLTWRFGLANLGRRAAANTVQVMALAIGLTTILILTFTRGDLLSTWQSKIPPDAPNRFVINIQPEQRAPLAEFFSGSGLTVPEFAPMVRGRYIELNGKAVNSDGLEDRGRRLAEREFNMSYMTVLPAHNEIIAGRFFSEADLTRGALSVEDGIAKTLGWKLGDVLTWQVAGENFSAEIVNIRKLDWDSMRVNFFVIATPGLLQKAPASYISSFYLPPAQATLTAQLSKRFPNVSVVDMGALMRQAQDLVGQVVSAVQFIFLFAVGSGVLVLYASLLATRDERVREAAVMRALGASRRQVLASQRAEFAVLGLLAGLLAAAGASAIGLLIAQKVFQFPYQMNYWVWLAGPALGFLCLGINLRAAARAVLNTPPLAALRDA